MDQAKKLGFGCMRLPMLPDGEVDLPQFKQMVDLFLERGFTYFDTAHPYLDGKSELAIREALAKRHPRETYTLADKLSSSCFETEADIRPFFEHQLACCGVTYFDYYLMHAIKADYYEKYTRTHAFEIARQLKEEGKIRHLGMSFHDTADVLDRILTERPELEFVQLQFNYLDYDDPCIQSRACYEVCRKHGVPVVVMEPVKGGALADPAPAAKLVLDGLHPGSDASYASYAVRFAAGFDGIFMVLSGMSTLGQMEENTVCMQNFQPLTEAEQTAVAQVRRILRSQDAIGCTACRYCTAGCPQAIDIPDLFACYNAKQAYKDWNSEFYYEVHTDGKGKASDCIGCGQCESACPQHLPVRALLEKVASLFESGN